MAHSLKMVKLGHESWSSGHTPSYRDNKYEAVNTAVHGTCTGENAHHATVYSIAKDMARVVLPRYDGKDPTVSVTEKDAYYRRVAGLVERRQQKVSGASQPLDFILSQVVMLETLVDETRGKLNFTSNGREEAWGEVWANEAHKYALSEYYQAQTEEERTISARRLALTTVASYALMHSEAVAAEMAEDLHLPSRADLAHLEESVEFIVAESDEPVQGLALAA